MAERLLDLGARGDIGTANDRAYATLGYTADLTLAAEFCSGIRLALGASALGRGAAGVEIAEFMQAALEIEAGAALDIELAAQLSADVRDTVGLHVVAMAQVQAFVRARLALGLTLDELLADALRRRDGALGLEDRLLLALVDESTLELGVEGSVQVAVAANAVLSARLCLQESGDRQAGFDMRLSGGAAFLYGKELGFFLRGRLPSVEGYLVRATGIVADDLALRADSPADRFALAVLGAFGRAVASGLARSPGARMSGAADALVPLLRDALVEGLIAGWAGLVDTALGGAGVPADLAASLRPQVETLLADEGPVAMGDLLGLVAALGEAAGAPVSGDAAPPFAVLSAQLHALVFLIDPASAAFDGDLPDHVLRQAGLGDGQRRFRQSSEALAVLQAGPLVAVLPGLPDPLGPLAAAALTALQDAGIGPFDLIRADSPPDPVALKRAALGFVTAVAAQHVIPRIDALLAGAAADGSLPPGVARAVAAMVHGTHGLMLPLLADTLAGRGDPKAQLDRFALMAVHIGATLIVEQVATLSAAAFSRSVALLDRRIDQMKDELHRPGSPFATMLVDTVLASLDDALPGRDLRRTPRRDAMRREVTAMIDALLEAGRTAFGPDTWSAPRVDRLRDGLVDLLTGTDGGRLDWAGMTPAQLAALIDELDNCPVLPAGTRDAVMALTDDLREVALIQARVFLLKVPAILGTHLGNLFRELVLATIEDALQAAMEAAQAALDRIEAALDDLARDLAAIEAALQAALDRIEAEIDALRDAMIAHARARIDDLIAMLDFDQPGVLTRIADLLAIVLGADAPLLDVLDPEAAARRGLRDARDRIVAALSHPAAFDGLRAAARASTHGRPIDVHAIGRTILSRHGFTADFETALAQLPLKSGRSLDAAGATARAAMGRATDALADTVQDAEARKLQQGHRRDRQGVLGRERDGLRRRLDIRGTMNAARGIRLTAPIPVDPDRGDLPVYGRHVYLEIDLGSFDPRKAGVPLGLSLADLMQPAGDGAAPGFSAVRRALDRGDLSARTVALVDLRLFVNGAEIDWQSLKRAGARLSGTLPPHLLRRGRNEVFLSVAAPAGSGVRSILHHVAFIRDPDRDTRPSNVLTIDPKGSVIDTRGNDHDDARGAAPTDREQVMIRNRSVVSARDLSDYRIEDARGHVFTFPPRTPVKPGGTETVVIGAPAAGTEHSWIETFRGRPIAVLNNDGERLILRAPDGRVIAQMHTGVPARNPDINFLDTIDHRVRK